MTDTTEAVERQWREIEQLREHVAGCHCSRCCFNVEALATAAYERGRVDAATEIAEQDCACLPGCHACERLANRDLRRMPREAKSHDVHEEERYIAKVCRAHQILAESQQPREEER